MLKGRKANRARSMDKYQVNEVDVSKGFADVLRIWSENFDRKFDYHHKYSWLYQDNPSGESDLYFLFSSEDEKEVGVQGVSPRQMEYNGERFCAGLVADFAVDQSHRTLGPGLNLLKTVLNKSKSKYPLTYSFPNKKAVPVFKRAGYRFTFEISRFSKVIKSRAYIEKRWPKSFAFIASYLLDKIIYLSDLYHYLRFVRGVNSEVLESSDQRFDALWNKTSFKRGLLLTQRSSNYIDWRIQEAGDYKQNIFLITDRSGEAIGYLIYFIQGNNCRVIDFIALDSGVSLKILFAAFLFHIRKSGVESISVEYKGTQDIDDSIASLGFIRRESRELFFVYDQEKLSEPVDGFFTAWDEDAV